jgi:CubicO group peptidase (beta-lactamase class C family)
LPTEAVVEGTVQRGWTPVADVFAKSLADGQELGAAVSVHVDGQPVVDLWGGIADQRTSRPWDRDTIVTVMSTTKGAAALCVHLLVERGLIDLDAPVARYWPEFAAGGKDRLTVRQALSHQAGLEYVDADLSFEELCRIKPVLRAIEAQEPHYEPGTSCGYHALTWGFIVGELVARTTGGTLGQLLAREVAAPLGLRAWIGLPADEEPNVARLEPSGPAWQRALGTAAMRLVMRRGARAITFGGALPLGLITGSARDLGSRRIREIELPAANMVTDARSLARMYAAAVGEVDGVRLLAPETVDRARELQTTHLPDPTLFGKRLPRRDYSLGFTADERLFGRSAFGFFGAGGSIAYADVDAGLGFAYVMNKMDGLRPTSRGLRLAEAVRACLQAA